jgi:alkanesulfonate monooxygenase SsuD/methylene tetrahydromethanopterin reductase-like flavin-dependent oxidoreductase (luciferase family)
VRFGLDVSTAGEWSDPRVLAELAVDAEAAGWDGFFVWDILLGSPGGVDDAIADPWVALAAIAVRTSRLRIGALVTPLARRRPWDVARAVATLDWLSGGRVVMGAGLGWLAEDFERFGEDPDPRSRAERLDEGLALLDAFWRGGPVTHAGRHYQVRDVTIGPRTVQSPRPPIWVAATWPRRGPVARAARWDGVCLASERADTGAALVPDDVAAVVDAVREQRGSLDGFDIVVYASCAHLEPVAAADAIARFERVGATWVIEATPATLAEHRALIRRGPPRAAG